MKKTFGFALALVLLLAALMIAPVYAATGVYDSVIRLHVLANSDTATDQALKLEVRDAILADSEGLLDGVTTRDEAAERVRAAIPRMEAVAKERLATLGCDADVRVTLDRESYPRRVYEDLALPAGEYLSLRVQIGEAAGQNWWCVLFPPMCLSAASEAREAACLAAGLTEGQYRMITDTKGAQYKLRFKVVEVAEQIFGN